MQTVMDYTFDRMVALAYDRQLDGLYWCLTHGVFDPYDYNDRAIVRRRLSERY